MNNLKIKPQSRLVFDMDETLFFTDKLNTKCYNLVLEKFGFKSIKNIKRVTSKIIKECYPQIDDVEILIIQQEKQNLFLKCLDKIEPNDELVKILKSKDKNEVIVYTNASLTRANAILKLFDLEDNILAMINKTENVSEDIKKLCELFNCKKKDLIFFDDDKIFVQKLLNNNCKTVLPLT